VFVGVFRGWLGGLVGVGFNLGGAANGTSPRRSAALSQGKMSGRK